MARTRKKNGETVFEHFPRPGSLGGYPGTPGMPGFPGNMYLTLATAYVPPQVFRDMYAPAEALSKGTLFPELLRPYTPMAPTA